jgi:hypothetical protein
MTTKDDYRLLQVFLSSTMRGVFEVAINGLGHLRCTCPGFRVRNVCKHLEFVADRLVRSGGEYTIAVPVGIGANACIEAAQSEETFRQFVLHYGAVEVL